MRNRPHTAMDARRNLALFPNGAGAKTPPSGYACLLPKTPRSAATPPTCTDKCETCFASYRSENAQRVSMHEYHAAVTDEEADAKVKSMTESTAIDLIYVRTKLELYGDTISKRWRKRTKDKRTALLLSAMPNLVSNLKYGRLRGCDCVSRTLLTAP